MALAILLVLTAINFLNYLDRYVMSAVLEPVRLELGLSDTQSGTLFTAFMVVYMVAAPVSGYFGDRWPRKWIVAGGVLLWSLATVGSGFAHDYRSLFLMRALIGVGEAGYATVAPGIIADLFDRSQRGRKLAYFYLATPVGSALGYLIGGWVGAVHGWRWAFFVAGVPGVLFALMVLLLPEPRRGLADGDADAAGGATLPLRATLRRLFLSAPWRINTIGTALMTFAIGGIAAWMPTFLIRAHGMGLERANTAFGAITVVTGLVGTLVGGVLGDRAYARGEGGYFRVSGLGLLVGAPFAFLVPFLPGLPAVFAAVFVAEFLLFLNTGPLNAALVGCVPAHLRASAVAVNVFFIHALGDAISPTLIGWVSEQTHIGLGIALTSIPVALAGGLLLRGARVVERLPEGLMAHDSGDPR
jgi:MFS family permease